MSSVRRAGKAMQRLQPKDRAWSLALAEYLAALQVSDLDEVGGHEVQEASQEASRCVTSFAAGPPCVLKLKGSQRP